MPEWVPGFLGWLWGPEGFWWQAALPLTIFVVVLELTYRGLLERASRTDLAAWVRKRAWKDLYRHRVTRLLEWTNRWCLTGAQFEERAALPWREWAWSGRLLDRALLLAVLYPILFLIGQWAVTGNSGQLGSIDAIPAQPETWLRIVVASSLAFCLLYLRYAPMVSSPLWRTIFGIAAVLAFFAFTVSFGEAFEGAPGLPFAVLIGLFFAFAFASAFASVGAGTVALAIAAAGIGAFERSVFDQGAFLVAGLIAFACLKFVSPDQGNFPTRRLLGSLLFTIAVLCGLLFHLDVINEFSSTLLVLFVLLPTVNAVFDFLSIGLTRYALRWGIAPGKFGIRTLVLSIGDAVAAGVLFIGLGCAAIALLHLMNAIAPAPLLALGATPDGPGLFAAIRAAPGDYWWLYVTFLSTLLPTLLHLLIALAAFGPVLMFGWRVPVARWMDESEHHFTKRLAASAMLALWLAVIITAPVLAGEALWRAFDLHAAPFGFWLLDVFEGFSLWFAALTG